MTKKWQLDRRTFLRGAGSVIALPFLEAMLPSIARAQAAAPTRLAFLMFPIGVLQDTWKPQGTGTSYQLPDQLASLAQYKADFSLVTGLQNPFGSVDGAGDHARGAGTFLTCARLNKSESDIRAGISVDQFVANAVGTGSAVKSLVVAAPGTGYGDSGYGAAYTSNISWLDESRPASRLTNPQAVFDALFGGYMPQQPSGNPEAEKKRRYRLSVLDSVNQEAKALHARLGAADQKKLDQYLTSVRETELKLQAAAQPGQPAVQCNPGQRPGTGYSFPDHTRLMLDLIVLAMQCDRTRVVTYIMDYEGSNRAFPFAGVQEGHHTVSHHADNASYPGQYQKISRWYAEQFAYFMGRVKAAQEATGSLLDSSMIVFGSGIHDGNTHNHTNLPILLAGKGNGQLTPGRVVPTSNARLANFYLTLINKMGVQAGSFGDSNGTVSGL